MTYASGSEKGGPVYRARSVAELAGIVQAYGEGELVADEAADEIDAVQVVMLPEQFERFREWLNHDLDTDVFQIPGLEDDLPTYAIAMRRT